MKYKKVKKKKLKPSFKIILFLLTLIFGLSYVNNNLNFKIFGKNNDKEVYKEVKDKEHRISMMMVGDALLHGYVYKDAYKNGAYDFSDQLVYMKDYVKDYDIKYWNQETIFGGKEKGYSGYPRFNSPSEFGDNMIDIGFNMVSLATNHTMDKGESGVLNSYNYWSNTNILYNGQADSEESRTNYIIKEINDISYTMLSYTVSTNGLRVPKSYLTNVYSKELVKSDVEALRDKVDVIIVAIHWGDEYSHVPNSFQKENAKYLSELGVDIIVGAHPHVVQPIDIIDDTVVYYSLGNFISNQGDLKKRVGLIGTLDIVKKIENGKETITIENIGGDLHYTQYTTSHTKYKAVPFSNPDIKKYLNNYENVYEKYKRIVTSYNENITIKQLGA